MNKWCFVFVAFVLFIGTGYGLEKEIEYINTLDKSTQKACVFVPDSYNAQKAAPLLVVAHYMGGSRHTAKKSGYYPECNKRGWLLVCPELHGQKAPGQYSLAAPNAQYDILDAIAYMKKHYNVDTSRIYIAGRSMGGMLTALMAAKHPYLFAGAVAGQGVYDLERFLADPLPNLANASYKEMAPLSDESAFDYKRRSAIHFARNLRYVPIVFWHGTNDTWVRPEQSKWLVAEAKKYNPYQSDVNWLECACHCADNYKPKWICEKLAYYQNKAEAGYKIKTKFFPELHFITDQDQAFFWLDVKTADKQAFCYVEAAIKNGVCTIQCRNAAHITLNLDKLAAFIKLKAVNLSSPANVTLTVADSGKIIQTAAGKIINVKLPEARAEK